MFTTIHMMYQVEIVMPVKGLMKLAVCHIYYFVYLIVTF